MRARPHQNAKDKISVKRRPTLVDKGGGEAGSSRGERGCGGNLGGELGRAANDGERRAGVEAVPSDPEDDHTEDRKRHVVTRHVDGLAANEAALAGTEEDGRDESVRGVGWAQS